MCEDRSKQKRRDFPFLSCHSPVLCFFPFFLIPLPPILLPPLPLIFENFFLLLYGVGGNVLGINETNICEEGKGLNND